MPFQPPFVMTGETGTGQASHVPAASAAARPAKPDEPRHNCQTPRTAREDLWRRQAQYRKMTFLYSGLRLWPRACPRCPAWTAAQRSGGAGGPVIVQLASGPVCCVLPERNDHFLRYHRARVSEGKHGFQVCPRVVEQCDISPTTCFTWTRSALQTRSETSSRSAGRSSSPCCSCCRSVGQRQHIHRVGRSQVEIADP